MSDKASPGTRMYVLVRCVVQRGSTYLADITLSDTTHTMMRPENVYTWSWQFYLALLRRYWVRSTGEVAIATQRCCADLRPAANRTFQNVRAELMAVVDQLSLANLSVGIALSGSGHIVRV